MSKLVSLDLVIHIVDEQVEGEDSRDSGEPARNQQKARGVSTFLRVLQSSEQSQK
jgi:hypothetical protein